MIHLKVSGSDVVGYETGTRREFDARHSGSPEWMFFDDDFSTQMVDLSDFYVNPKSYYIDKYQALQKRLHPKVDPYIAEIIDNPDIVLIDPDGAVMIENTRFPKILTLDDSDNIPVQDSDGDILTETQ